MAVNEPIDPRVRLVISQWPEDAPRGAVSTFCAEHGISRKSFYEIRKRARTDGPAAVLEPRSRRPRSSPSKLSDEVKAQAVAVRAALEAGARPGDKIIIADLNGEVLTEHVRPAPGIRYVGNGRRPGPKSNNYEPSPKS